MQLDNILDQVREQLAAAAALGDERTRDIAGALATAVTPAVRLAIVTALHAAADEISATLVDYPGSPAVTLALDGDQVRVDVHAAAPAEPPPATPRADESDASARISLRLPESLKADVEAAAAREGISVNSWLVRAASTALQPPWAAAARFAAGWADAAGRHGGPSAHHITGWING
jgi:hypothetical protein